MNRILVLMTAIWLSAAGAVVGSGETKHHGRIVAYDWVLRQTTQSDDFVLKISKTQANALPYARIVYKPFWGWDAPPAEAKYLLDRWAFVGRGAMWEFSVHTPQTDESGLPVPQTFQIINMKTRPGQVKSRDLWQRQEPRLKKSRLFN